MLVGDSGVGKSCLLLRFADDTFIESYISTIGVDFRFKTLNVDGKLIKLQIWDTAGQERFRTITSAYYRGADGVILVFDKTNKDSFNHIPDWLDEINKYSGNSEKVLVGNKDDMVEQCQVDLETARNFAESQKMAYVETSALSAHQVELAFQTITRKLMEEKNTPATRGQKLDPRNKVKLNKCC